MEFSVHWRIDAFVQNIQNASWHYLFLELNQLEVPIHNNTVNAVYKLNVFFLKIQIFNKETGLEGGTVAQAVAPTTFGLDAHGGHGFESSPMSFLLSTPQLFSLSFPVQLCTID